MLFLGIDPSLSETGIVLVDKKLNMIVSDCLSTPSIGVERLFHLELKFLDILEKYKSDIVFCSIESGAYGEVGRLYDLGEWAGIIKLNLFKLGINFVLVAPLQLKKYISGFGKNRNKHVVMLDVYKNYGVEIRNDNIADAFVLAVIARDYYCVYNKKRKNINLQKYQQAVLENINKSNRNTLKSF